MTIPGSCWRTRWMKLAACGPAPTRTSCVASQPARLTARDEQRGGRMQRHQRRQADAPPDHEQLPRQRPAAARHQREHGEQNLNRRPCPCDAPELRSRIAEVPWAVDPGRGEQVQRHQDGAGNHEGQQCPIFGASAHMWWASSAAVTITMRSSSCSAARARAGVSRIRCLDGSVTCSLDARNGMQPQPCGEIHHASSTIAGIPKQAVSQDDGSRVRRRQGSLITRAATGSAASAE